MTRLASRIVFNAVALFAAVQSASASDWASRYTLPGGGAVKCTVSFDLDSGSYTLDADGRVGSLSSITYSGAGPGVTLVRGRWNLEGQTGSFEWRIVPNGSQFLGRWFGDAGGSGAWNGGRIGGGGGGPVPGGPVPGGQKP